jgi:hypothetical protein
MGRKTFFAQLSFRVNLSGVLLLDITSVADSAVRRIVISEVTLFDSDSDSEKFFLVRKKKKNGSFCFENRFLTVVTAPSDKPSSSH